MYNNLWNFISKILKCKLSKKYVFLPEGCSLGKKITIFVTILIAFSQKQRENSTFLNKKLIKFKGGFGFVILLNQLLDLWFDKWA